VHTSLLNLKRICFAAICFIPSVPTSSLFLISSYCPESDAACSNIVGNNDIVGVAAGAAAFVVAVVGVFEEAVFAAAGDAAIVGVGVVAAIVAAVVVVGAVAAGVAAAVVAAAAAVMKFALNEFCITNLTIRALGIHR
jgi:hypothetical protein